VTRAWGELDHVIVFCDVGAPEADALLGRGLHEGPRNSHPGQGTANRRFFFRNAYLEFLWVEQAAEAQSDEVRPTRLWERWSRRAQDCPFGLVFRPGGRLATGTIPAWTYAPAYFPKGFSIEVASGIPPGEPLLFYLPFAQALLVEDVQPGADGPRIGPIVGITIHLPNTGSLSPALDALVAAGRVTVEPAHEFSVDLVHAGDAPEIVDLRPRLALRFVPGRGERRRRH
jgi:hypothetical protein